MKTDSLSTALNDIINSKISKNFFTSITSKRIYSYLDKDIVIGTSADGLAMVFKDEDLVKMAWAKYADKYTPDTDRYTYQVMPYQGEYTDESFGTFSKHEHNETK